ncbi:T9SS type A sorting domain-containing protein [Hymenobacter properus]|uniref:T9SS type A sorting domain-containing protein n=1 Tax=Hymenobacter properus TaxID=2791026 RepID=A0A931BJA2_9BACT|nr:T9SS type A sorting domain-containing protein [Hymenobacter properus]MBF9142526.1 T9SS type A sorting domain-containing protein [Hymenobacter properus]MBR7721333.1 T9SS type A sorting domain-containing protein [Microvirga sp. SRT04]
MKASLLLILRTILAWALLGGLPAAQASHMLGGEMTYRSLGNNQYRVRFRLYQDCSGAPTTALTLECRNGGGCNTPATLTAPLLQQGAAFEPAALCTSAVNTCQNPVSNYPMFRFVNYEATVTLAPGQWTLSTYQTSRPSLANVVSGDLYTEAFLDNRGSSVANNSPQFDAEDIPVQYVNWKQFTTFSFSALEPDGDSVACSLVAPLQACNTPLAYRPVWWQSYPYPIPWPVTCFFTPNSFMPGYFSPSYPINMGFDTLGTCPNRTGVLRTLRFNQEARTIVVSPYFFDASATAASGNNKYLQAVQADEYRYVNGVRRLIGRVRHEMVLIVVDGGSNTVPNPVQVANQTINSGARIINALDSTQVEVEACSYSRLTLDFTDPDNLRTPSAGQLLTVTVPTDLNTNPLLLDGGDVGTFSLSGNGTARPRGTLYLQPSAAAAGRTIRINVRVEDNACPVKGRQNRVIVIKIHKSLRAAIALAGTTARVTTLSLPIGSTLDLRGLAMRPDSLRLLASGTTVAQSYSYQWQVRGNGLNPAQATSASITVAPTIPSRYLLAVTPTGGFGGGCGDTTSVLVTLMMPLAPVVTASGAVLSSSYATGNQWYLNGQLIPGATGQTITPTGGGTYTVVVTIVAGGVTYTSPMSAPFTVLSAVRAAPGTSLRVVPNPTPDGRLQVTLTGYAQPVALTVLDALGRKVAESMVAAPNPQGSTQEVNLSHCEAGFYLLQVRTASSLEIRRIVRE